ncbi:hypothetical protein [Afifella marina]|uniref:Invasion protein IalB, involved in pathogenesis n=1 Tax=Afifella marina DSM 2698 TaxID=1120955 RepID=A0A1G5N4M5_AFIMA|nr:hypothetical protein [Afifella marina]MBK1622435.1 hypothetical protein [Afifella marina DSM 2698]MBK1626851.1 hypothetical protein [Afifella marina]MBK5919219.1 hypothetical protein [Afifella marina]RAI21262.1 hypothetical protein CH311_07235 [Afifella marina DSM 2698]SCZ32104.1 hypothetical protein SAMN03080610_01473 [Afifella marina DSM 2698]
MQMMSRLLALSLLATPTMALAQDQAPGTIRQIPMQVPPQTENSPSQQTQPQTQPQPQAQPQAEPQGQSGTQAPAAAGSTEPSSDSYSWRSSLTDSGAAAFIAGCDQCDDVPLDISCTLAGGDITVRPTIAIESALEGDLVEVAFEVDRDIFRRDGRLHQSELYGGFVPEVTIKESDPLLYALSVGDSLNVAVGQQRLDLTLKGSAAALRTMRSACTKPASTPVPPSSEDPAPLQPDSSVEPDPTIRISPPPPPEALLPLPGSGN